MSVCYHWYDNAKTIIVMKIVVSSHITPAGVATPWAHLFIVFSWLHLFTFLFFQVLSTPPLFLHFLHSFLVCSCFALIHGDFVCIQIFRLLCVFLSHPFLLHLCNFFLHFHIDWIFLSYLVAMDDEAVEVFVMSCLLLLIQLVQQMFQSSLAILPSLETLEQLLRHSP